MGVPQEVSNDEYEKVVEMLETASKGEINNLTLETEFGKQFFSKDVISRSVITLKKL